MEARDSSPSSSAAANRDASSPAEDDAVLSVAAALAKDAALHFQSGKFAECVDVLNQLLLKKPDDPKVLHNVAIVEYLRDGCSDPKKLLDVLNNVKKRSEELARSLGEQVEAGASLASKAVLVSKSSTLAHPFSSASSANIVHMDDFGTYVATVNIAVIWFHLHEYVKALSVLDPLYQNIGPIDETTALHICLLLLDAGLACQDVPKSADVLIYLEKAFGVSGSSQSDNGGTAPQQSANLVARFCSLPSSSLTIDASNAELAANNASEKSLSRTLSEEILEDDQPVFLDIDVTRPTGLSLSSDISRNSVDRSISSVDLKLKLHLYRVRFLLLTRNLKQAKREVKHAMNIARGRDSPMALLLKSQLEYARGNHRKAIKLLMASSNRTDTGILSLFHNNLGCIYYQLGKYHTSLVFFSKALNNCSSLRKDKPLKLSTFSQDNSLLIIYNCGMQYLACGKPLLAARCFQKAGLIFYNRPLLWLRLAECCLMAFEKGLLKANTAQDKSEIRISVIGKGKWRQLVFEDGILRNGNVDLERGDLSLGGDGQPKLSLPLARDCLHNALYLLNRSELSYLKSLLPANCSVDENDTTESPSSENSNHKNLQNIDLKVSTVAVGLGQINLNGDAKEQKGGTTQELVQNSLMSYEDIRKRENMLIKQALLANLAYVELELGNPIKAHLNARSLLELPECSRVYLFLGHTFAAEALCLLNREKEAIQHLSVYLSEGNVELPFSQEDCEQRQVDRTGDCDELNGGQASAKNSSPQDPEGFVFFKPEEARAALYTNFAALYAMQGQFELAHQFVSQALSLTPNSPEANLTAVYVNLMLGKSREALAKLKQCSHITFLSSGLTLNKSL